MWLQRPFFSGAWISEAFTVQSPIFILNRVIILHVRLYWFLCKFVCFYFINTNHDMKCSIIQIWKLSKSMIESMVFHFIEGGLMTEWNWQPSKFKSIFFISRFISKRRLLLISAPSEDDYLFQQQLSAVRGQECPLGTCFKRPAVTRKCYKEARSQTWVDLSWLWNLDLKKHTIKQNCTDHDRIKQWIL